MIDARPLVLLADADPAARALTGDAFAAAGYAVTTAADGPAVLALIADPFAAFDAAVLSEQLPGLSGRDVLRIARSWGVETPILLVTYGPGPELAPGEGAGGARVLRGPVAPPTLTRAVAELVGRRAGAV